MFDSVLLRTYGNYDKSPIELEEEPYVALRAAIAHRGSISSSYAEYDNFENKCNNKFSK